MSVPSRWRRLWQPHRGLFWLMLTFNALSSGMAWYLNLARPQGVLLGMLTVVALTNALMGMWLLWRLWTETSPDKAAISECEGDSGVQGTADQQER